MPKRDWRYNQALVASNLRFDVPAVIGTDIDTVCDLFGEPENCEPVTLASDRFPAGQSMKVWLDGRGYGIMANFDVATGDVSCFVFGGGAPFSQSCDSLNCNWTNFFGLNPKLMDHYQEPSTSSWKDQGRFAFLSCVNLRATDTFYTIEYIRLGCGEGHFRGVVVWPMRVSS